MLLKSSEAYIAPNTKCLNKQRGFESMANVYIVDGARTAFTAFGGSFAGVDAVQLGTATAVEALQRSGVKPNRLIILYMAGHYNRA